MRYCTSALSSGATLPGARENRLKKQIIDDRVYMGSNWLMYSSRKTAQLAGGYEVTSVWERKDQSAEEAAAAAVEYLSSTTFVERSHTLSIFPDPETELITMEWTKAVPHVQPYVRENKKRAATPSSSSSSSKRQHIEATGNEGAVFTLLHSIVKDVCTDSTSTLDRSSRTVTDDDISYRFSRHGESNCIHGGSHSSNGFYLHLHPFKHTVDYVCLSDKCGDGKERVRLDCADLAKQWAALDSPPVFNFETDEEEEEPAAEMSDSDMSTEQQQYSGDDFDVAEMECAEEDSGSGIEQQQQQQEAGDDVEQQQQEAGDDVDFAALEREVAASSDPPACLSMAMQAIQSVKSVMIIAELIWFSTASAFGLPAAVIPRSRVRSV